MTGPTVPVPQYPSKPLAKIDRRRSEYRILQEVREALTRHVGGQPSPTHAVIIERVAWLSLRCSQIDKKVIEGTLTDYDAKSALPWSLAIQRSCKLLGLQATDAAPPSLADVLREGTRRDAERQHPRRDSEPEAFRTLVPRSGQVLRR